MSRKKNGASGSRSGRYSRPGYQPLASVNVRTLFRLPNQLHSTAYGSVSLDGKQ